jgi:uncharacterized membrane protein
LIKGRLPYLNRTPTGWREHMQIFPVSSSVAIVLSLVLLSSIPKDAHAGSWSVCNKTPDKLTIAIGYANSTGGINTEGWWTLNPCDGCANVLNQNKAADYKNVYLHARGVVEGDESFCVRDNAFTLNNAQGSNCGNRRSFRSQNVNLNKQWTTNITGRGRSGRVCF